jgi:hypothetical protein
MTMTAAGVATTPQERLQARLADPATIDSLNRLLDRVDLMAFVLEAVDGFLRRGDTVVDSISDGVREVRQAAGFDAAGAMLAALPRLARSGAEIAEVTTRPAFSSVLQSGLLERLGDPRTLKLLETLFDKLDTAVFLLEAVDGFLRRGDEIAESAASLVGDLRNTSVGVDLGEMRQVAERTPKILEALGRLTESRALDRVPDLVNATLILAEAGMLDPTVVRVLGDVGRRLAGAYEEVGAGPAESVGRMGLLRAMGDPDVQKVLGLLVAVARAYGKNLR